MDRQSRQEALDNISPEDLAKVKAHQAKTKGISVDNEWLLIAEFAMKFGWDAYKDFKKDIIPMDELLTLVEASRRVDYAQMFNNAQTAFIAAVSAQSKRSGATFNKLTRDIVNRTKADE